MEIYYQVLYSLCLLSKKRIFYDVMHREKNSIHIDRCHTDNIFSFHLISYIMLVNKTIPNSIKLFNFATYGTESLLTQYGIWWFCYIFSIVISSLTSKEGCQK